MFIAPGLVRLFRLALRFEEEMVVGERFHISPLLPLARSRREALEVSQTTATGRGSTHFTEIVPAAVQGRVDLLFAPINHPLWGRFDPQRQQAEAHAERRSNDEDFHELAIAARARVNERCGPRTKLTSSRCRKSRLTRNSTSLAEE